LDQAVWKRLPSPTASYVLADHFGNHEMKLDTLLSRAARKDFYDLYFICQTIPLKQLLALAPQKYSSIRDFEAQVVKRLVFFQNAENQIDPPLLMPVTWQGVQEYFILQAKEIGREWLQ
jgi:hypothetical protein